LGDGPKRIRALRDAIMPVSSRVLAFTTAGKAIGSTGGHADPTNGFNLELPTIWVRWTASSNGPEDAVKAVRQHYKLGDDVINFISSASM